MTIENRISILSQGKILLVKLSILATPLEYAILIPDGSVDDG